jgi:hypothetical protein
MKNIGGLTHKNIKLRNDYNGNKRRCDRCDKEIPYEKRMNRFCSRTCATSHSNATRNPDWKNKVSNALKEKYANGKLLVPKRQKLERVEKCCLQCGEMFSAIFTSKQKFCSHKCANVGMDRKNAGGYREKSGRGKSGWYKGIYCNSSWELAWVIYSLEHGLKFKRNTKGFEYSYGGKTHKYYPDFLLESRDEYIEIKGYDSEQWAEKKKQFSGILSVIGKEEIKHYIDYTTTKYGKNFTNLYEK